VLLVVFLGVMVLAAWLAARGARSIFHPVEKMIQVVRATQAGDDRRIGRVDSNDEIGELARQFDTMLNRLQERSRQIQRAADELEGQVESRTQELKEKNENLETTIRLLREARERLVAAEKMAAVGELAAGIAHEINNPAEVILGNLDVLVAELGEAAEPVQVEVDLIAQQVDRIRTIVDSLLQYARPTGPTAPLSEVDVNRVVENTLPLVRHNIKMSSIKVAQHLNATRLIHINKYQLQQVLINLIVNAVNAVLEGGSMELTTEDWAERGVVISIKDDGKGIAPNKLSRVFDPFFTTDSQHGTGLGLSVSYSLVRRYGGDITVESAIGKGCVFRVWLLSEPRLSGTEGVPSQSEVRNAV
jgi:two-component system NtrC family sensor kinase